MCHLILCSMHIVFISLHTFLTVLIEYLLVIFQVIGSAGSLLVISPLLTGLTLLCIPSVVIGGSFIGSLLRKLSRESQAQVFSLIFNIRIISTVT